MEKILKIIQISILLLIVALFLIFTIDIWSGADTITKEVKCYDRFRNEIKNLTCEKVIVCTKYGLFNIKCPE